MDRQALQSAVGTGLTAADYRGMSADQVRQTQQIGMQQFGMMAQIIDAMQGRQLQREQMQQMERHYEAQREMAEKKFELMQREEVRAEVTQAFNMFATKASHELEKRRLTLEEQLKTQQMTLTGMQINQLREQISSAKGMRETFGKLTTPVRVGNSMVPLGVVLQDDNLTKIYIEQIKAEAHARSDLPAALREVDEIANRIMAVAPNIGEHAAKADAYLLAQMKDIPSLDNFIQMASNSPRLMRLLKDEKAMAEFYEVARQLEINVRNDILIGKGPNAMNRPDLGIPQQAPPSVEQIKEFQAALMAENPDATIEEINFALQFLLGYHPNDILQPMGRIPETTTGQSSADAEFQAMMADIQRELVLGGRSPAYEGDLKKEQKERQEKELMDRLGILPSLIGQ
jgi:hypothetical protein